MSVERKFWLENPCSLVTSLNFFPRSEMSKGEKLNALTRLSLLIAGVMYFMKYPHWLSFLVIAVLLAIILFYTGNSPDKDGKTSCETEGIEGFTIVPTYDSNDFSSTVVSPTYSEEWHIPPPSYDISTNTVPTSTMSFEKPARPQSYPYGQYLTKTNLLPSDEYMTHMGCGGPRKAREYMNSAFLRHDLAFRDNMSRLYKKKLDRRFRHYRYGGGTGSDTFSPYSSY